MSLETRLEERNELSALVAWMKTFPQIEQLTNGKENESPIGDIDLLRDSSASR